MRGKSAALASVSLSVFVLYAVKTMKKTMAALDEANRTLAQIKTPALRAASEATALIHTVNRTVKDVKGRIGTVDPLLETTHEVGDVLHTIAHSVKEALTRGAEEDGAPDALPAHADGARESVALGEVPGDESDAAGPSPRRPGGAINAGAEAQGITIRFGDQAASDTRTGRPAHYHK